jgi:hypothetical protein
MEYRSCIDCGETFYADERWKIRCVDCWREWKRAKDLRHSDYALEEQRLRDWGFRLAEQQAELDAQEMRLRQQKDNVTSELKAMLPKLIQLAHPDKHNGSQLSQAVTQWLLSLR